MDEASAAPSPLLFIATNSFQLKKALKRFSQLDGGGKDAPFAFSVQFMHTRKIIMLVL